MAQPLPAGRYTYEPEKKDLGLDSKKDRKVPAAQPVVVATQATAAKTLQDFPFPLGDFTPYYFKQFEEACTQQAEGVALAAIKLLKTNLGFEPKLYELAKNANFPSVIQFMVKKDSGDFDPPFLKTAIDWAQEKGHASLVRCLVNRGYLQLNADDFLRLYTWALSQRACRVEALSALAQIQLPRL